MRARTSPALRGAPAENPPGSPKRRTKLLICGKGGAGKSTLTALLARTAAAAGRRVVVLDTDVSNVALHRALGVEPPPDLSGHFAATGLWKRLLEETRRTGIPPAEPRLGRWSLESLPAGHFREAGGVRLLRAGKISDATQYGKGRWVAVARQFLAGLTLGDDDRAFIDADAGIEFLVRGLGGSCDALLAVVDPTPDAIDLARHAANTVAGSGIPVFCVLNRTDAESARALAARLPPELPLLGAIPRDPALLAAGLEGRPLTADRPEVAALLDALENELAR